MLHVHSNLKDGNTLYHNYVTHYSRVTVQRQSSTTSIPECVLSFYFIITLTFIYYCCLQKFTFDIFPNFLLPIMLY